MKRVPLVIYADKESILEPIDEEIGTSTRSYQEHKTCSYGYIGIGKDKYSIPYKSYCGEDASKKFVLSILEEDKKFRSKYYNKKKEKDNEKTVVMMHNLRGYDGHLILKELGRVAKELGRELKTFVIPNNKERYIGFGIDNVVFIDSLQHLNSSLEKLSSNLERDKFIETSKEFKEEELDLITRKGVYPYDYIDSISRLDETELPPKEAFYSKLNKKHISDDDYNHAKKVWDTFNCRTLKDYHDVYLKSDVLQLADIFENYRAQCMKDYGLDPARYFTAPGLSWDAMLKMTGVEIELITDIDMQLMVEKGMRGGTSFIGKRYSKANNKYISEYSPEEKSKYIMYLDANNLYGWAMSKPLPFGGFRFINPEDFNLNKYLNQNEEGISKGAIIECDLECPKELHDKFNDFPLAPESMVVTKEMQSKYTREFNKKYKIEPGKAPKLIANLYNKSKYVLHYRNLELYLNLGLKLTKIHRVIEFDQSKWLKPYIDYNTRKRANAKNAFEKDFYKLMNNSVFGKTMENVRKRTNVELIMNRKRFRKVACKPTYKGCNIIDTNLVAAETSDHTILLNKPSYIGMCILDLSKTLMYDFHYNYIKEKYGDRAILLMTDTDSLMYEIETDDVYEDFNKDRDLFDNSDYPRDSKYYFNDNKKVIGKMKDEAAGKIIAEQVGLRSKMYSYKTDDSREYKKCKGIKKTVIESDMKHESYKETLLSSSLMRHSMNIISSKNHRITSQEVNKISLSCGDDKSCILDDGINRLSYGHWRIDHLNDNL